MSEAPFPGVETHHRGNHYAVLDAGAQVLAWTPKDQLPVLWVSPLATFEPGIAVRGGVPVVFPWFGAGPAGDREPAHGFARTAAWQRVSVIDELAAAGRLEVRHRLTADGFDSPPFTAELVSEFTSTRLRISLVVTNSGSADFTYEEALHTYLAVGDVARTSVDGLDGCSYRESVGGAAPATLVQAGPVRFSGETDRLYDHTGEVVVSDAEWNRKILLSKEGSATTVVWNPGSTRGAAMRDVGTNWPGFVCIEAANTRSAAVTVPPGGTHLLAQTLKLV